MPGAGACPSCIPILPAESALNHLPGMQHFTEMTEEATPEEREVNLSSCVKHFNYNSYNRYK